LQSFKSACAGAEEMNNDTAAAGNARAVRRA
jgi:hypothetical protein